MFLCFALHLVSHPITVKNFVTFQLSGGFDPVMLQVTLYTKILKLDITSLQVRLLGMSRYALNVF